MNFRYFVVSKFRYIVISNFRYIMISNFRYVVSNVFYPPSPSIPVFVSLEYRVLNEKLKVSTYSYYCCVNYQNGIPGRVYFLLIGIVYLVPDIKVDFRSISITKCSCVLLLSYCRNCMCVNVLFAWLCQEGVTMLSLAKRIRETVTSALIRYPSLHVVLFFTIAIVVTVTVDVTVILWMRQEGVTMLSLAKKIRETVTPALVR